MKKSPFSQNVSVWHPEKLRPCSQRAKIPGSLPRIIFVNGSHIVIDGKSQNCIKTSIEKFSILTSHTDALYISEEIDPNSGPLWPSSSVIVSCTIKQRCIERGKEKRDTGRLYGAKQAGKASSIIGPHCREMSGNSSKLASLPREAHAHFLNNMHTSTGWLDVSNQ